MGAASNGVALRFGENMRRVRKRAGVSQEAGFRATLHRTEIGLLERGERVPKIDTVIKIAAALGVRIDCALFDGITWQNGAITTTPGTFSVAASGKDQGSRG